MGTGCRVVDVSSQAAWSSRRSPSRSRCSCSTRATRRLHRRGLHTPSVTARLLRRRSRDIQRCLGHRRGSRAGRGWRDEPPGRCRRSSRFEPTGTQVLPVDRCSDGCWRAGSSRSRRKPVERSETGESRRERSRSCSRSRVPEARCSCFSRADRACACKNRRSPEPRSCSIDSPDSREGAHLGESCWYPCGQTRSTSRARA